VYIGIEKPDIPVGGMYFESQVGLERVAQTLYSGREVEVEQLVTCMYSMHICKMPDLGKIIVP